MSDLIDRNKLRIAIIEAYEQEFPTATGAFDEFATRIVPNIIKQQPAVDAVEVVRCGECKYLYKHDCPSYPMITPDDWFCANGRRKIKCE